MGRGETNVTPGADALVILVIEEEEHLVLVDRAAEGAAPSGALQLGEDPRAVQGLLPDIDSLQVLAEEMIAAEVIIGRPVELIRAALGDGIDRGAGETGLAHIVGGDLDRQLLDGVDREGVEERGQAGAVEAEHIVDAGAVNLDGVETVVLAHRGDLGLLAVAGGHFQRHERRSTDQVGQGALGGGLGRQAGAVKVRARAGGAGVEVVAGAGGDELLELDHLGFQRQGHVDVVAQLGGDIGDAGVSITGNTGAHRVGAAHGKAAEVEFALRVGD